MLRQTFVYEGRRHDIRAKDCIELARKIFAITGLKEAKPTPKSRKEKSKVPGHAKTVEAWGEEFISVYKGHLAKRTVRSYEERFKRNIYPYIGDKMLCEVSHLDCQKILNSLRGLSKDTIKKIRNDLNQLFEKAIVNEYIEKNPLNGCEIPKGGVNERRALNEKEMAAFLSIRCNSPYGLYFSFMLYCGLRPHEMSYIQGKDIQGDTLHIRGTKTEGADRFVPIPDVLLKQIPCVGRNEYLFKSIKGIAPLTEAHRRYIWSEFKKELQAAYGETLEEDLVPYCFRHTYCTNLQEAGVSMNVARELMGHTNISTTQRYTHNSCHTLNAARVAMNAFYGQ